MTDAWALSASIRTAKRAAGSSDWARGSGLAIMHFEEEVAERLPNKLLLCLNARPDPGFSKGLSIRDANRFPQIIDRWAVRSVGSLTGATLLEQHMFVSSRGQRFEYYDGGRGEPILFLTALAFSKDIWAYQIADLQADFRLIFPHLPGHAGSTFDGTRFTFEQLADDLAELLDHLSIDRVHLVGWCMAGNIAQVFALKYPDRLSSLALICTTPTSVGARGVSQADLRDYSQSPLTTYVVEFQNIYEKSFFEDKTVQAHLDLIYHSRIPVDPNALAFLFAELFGFDTQSKLHSVKSPTLIVAGKWDIAFPVEQVRLLAKHIENSELVEIGNGGHLPFVTSHAYFNSRLREFLTNSRTRMNGRRVGSLHRPKDLTPKEGLPISIR